jgi:integrase/recombinase XerD
MAQHMPWLDGKTLWDIDSRLIADIIRARTAKASNATIKRGLVALSSVLNFAIDQGWRDDNPALITACSWIALVELDCSSSY